MSRNQSNFTLMGQNIKKKKSKHIKLTINSYLTNSLNSILTNGDKLIDGSSITNNKGLTNGSGLSSYQEITIRNLQHLER